MIAPNPQEKLYIVYSNFFQEYITCHRSSIFYFSENKGSWQFPDTLVISNKWKNIFGRQLNYLFTQLSYEVTRWYSDMVTGRLNSSNSIYVKQEQYLRVTGLFQILSVAFPYNSANNYSYIGSEGLTHTAKTLYYDLVFYEIEYSPSGIRQKVVDIKTLVGRKLLKLFS